MIFCARATRGRGLPSLDARSGRSVSPHPWREIKRAWRKHVYRSMRAVKGALATPFKSSLEKQTGLAQQPRAGYREETALHDFYSVVFSSSIVESRLSALKHVHYMLIDDGVFN